MRPPFFATCFLLLKEVVFDVEVLVDLVGATTKFPPEFQGHTEAEIVRFMFTRSVR